MVVSVKVPKYQKYAYIILGTLFHRVVSIAQLVEHSTVNRKVESSNLSWDVIFLPNHMGSW
jgi:hypothetical protein